MPICRHVENDTSALSRGMLLRHSDTVHVKRLSFSAGKNRISVKSDNGIYDDWEDLAPGDIDVVGKVIWVGRHLR